MSYMIAGIVFGLCLFILPMWAYRLGVKDGLALNQGKTPETIKNPVQAIVEHRERKTEKKQNKEAEDALAEGLANLFAYDGTPQKKAGET